MKSRFKKLNFRDIAKGFITSFIASLATTAEQLISNRVSTGAFTLSLADFKFVLAAAGIAGFSYLVKNWLTNSKDQFGKSEPEPNQPAPPAL